MNACAQFILMFIPFFPHSTSHVTQIQGVLLSSLVNDFWQHPYEHLRRYVSVVILNQSKLTMKADRYISSENNIWHQGVEEEKRLNIY